MTPNEASKMENSPVVWYNIYGAYLTLKYGQPKFKAGQTVRISKYKSTFDKGYLPEEFFKVKEVIMGRPIVYKLQDLKSEDSTGIYYEDELSPYDETDETTYKVEKVFGKKTVKGKKLARKKFNEWLPAEYVTVK